MCGPRVHLSLDSHVCKSNYEKIRSPWTEQEENVVIAAGREQTTPGNPILCRQRTAVIRTYRKKRLDKGG